MPHQLQLRCVPLAHAYMRVQTLFSHATGKQIYCPFCSTNMYGSILAIPLEKDSSRSLAFVCLSITIYKATHFVVAQWKKKNMHVKQEHCVPLRLHAMRKGKLSSTYTSTHITFK
jgi:hypothetical protein